MYIEKPTPSERRARAAGNPIPLRVRRRFSLGTGRSRPHVHLDFAEKFEVLEGEALAELDGDRLRLTAEPSRSTLYVPPGVPHVNPYNDGRDDLSLRQSFLPGTWGARSYVNTLAKVLGDGRDHQGELPWPVVLAVADVTRDRTYLTPASKRARRADAWSFNLQRRILFPVGRLVAGTRDYVVHLDEGYDRSGVPEP